MKYENQGASDKDPINLPHRGGRTGVIDGSDYGADLSPDATNRVGSIRSSTGSDPIEQCHPPGDRVTHDNPGTGGREY